MLNYKMSERDWLGFIRVWWKSLGDWVHWILCLNAPLFSCTLPIVKKGLVSHCAACGFRIDFCALLFTVVYVGIL